MAREAVNALQFFRALYEHAGAGFIEIRPLLDNDDPLRGTDEGKEVEWKARKFFKWPAQAEAMAKYVETLNGKLHVYFGVGVRQHGKKPNKEFQLGSKENVALVTAAFADFDFKDVPEDELRGMLGKFPLRPSVVVRSGNGVHVYWLLLYPAMGEKREDLQLVNLALLLRFKAQRGPQDYSRILRVPGTANIKARYPDPKPLTEVTYFNPSLKYSLEQFLEPLKLEVEQIRSGKTPRLSRPEGDGPPRTSPEQHRGSSSPGSPPPPASPQAPQPPSGPLPPIPQKELTPELMQKLAEILTGIWIDHHHHQLAMYVSGILVHAGYTEDSALRLLRAVCTLSGDTHEVHDRERACRDTYQKHLSGKPVAGGPSMEALVKGFPGIIRERAIKVAEIVRKSLPKSEKKTSGNGADPDFTIEKLINFDSRPARWKVFGKTSEGDEFEVGCETPVLFNYTQFQAACFEQSHLVLADIKKTTWTRLLSLAPIEKRETPKEASPEGAIETALEEFLEDCRQINDPGLLKAFPGYDDGATFFKNDTFKKFLKDKGYRFEDQIILDIIKRFGWKSSPKRLGGRVVRLWVKDTKPAAPTNGTTHPPATTASPPQPDKPLELFP